MMSNTSSSPSLQKQKEYTTELERVLLAESYSSEEAHSIAFHLSEVLVEAEVLLSQLRTHTVGIQKILGAGLHWPNHTQELQRLIREKK